MNIKLWHIGALAVVAILGWWGVSEGLYTYHRHQAGQHEVQANHHDQEAQAHVNQAQSVPDHSQELAKAQADVDRAREEVARLKRLLAAKPILPLPDTPHPDSPVVPGNPSDNRDQIIAAQDVLIKAQDTQITGLKLALADEQKRSFHWEAAYNDEHKALVSQQAAFNARPKERFWSAGIRVETRFNGNRQIGASVRRDLGPGYVEVSGFSDHVDAGFGWRW